MRGRDAFSNYHPLVNFLYFCLIFGFSMFFTHPVCLLISLFCALCLNIKLTGAAALKGLFCFSLPALVAISLINPAFNHQGTVILCYLPSGNPLTLESILYGLSAGTMLVCVLTWFSCFNEVITSDKFIYLFGRIIPIMSLLLSMALSFVPKFKAQFEQVKQARTCLVGRDVTNGSLLKRLGFAVSCFSIMVTKSLEGAIETADSMKSRGYGLPKRSAFSVYIISKRDKFALLWLFFCAIFVLCGSLSGCLFWRYFPSIRGVLIRPATIATYIVYFALCITPSIIDIVEEIKWKYLHSKI